MDLVPVRGAVRAIRVDFGSERVIGRDTPWICEALQTGVTDLSISRAQVWVRAEEGMLLVESSARSPPAICRISVHLLPLPESLASACALRGSRSWEGADQAASAEAADHPAFIDWLPANSSQFVP